VFVMNALLPLLLSCFEIKLNQGEPSVKDSRKPTGATLPEVLIALMLLALCGTGLLLLQVQSLRLVTQSTQQQQALWLAGEALARIRGNPQSAPLVFQSPANATPIVDCLAVSCTSEELARWDRHSIDQQAAALMPGSEWAFRSPCSGQAGWGCVVVAWSGLRLADCLQGALSLHQSQSCLVLRVRT
jgi:Tfp pilus assembly protein PilV